MTNPRVEVEIARRYLVDGWQSFAYMPGGSWGIQSGSSTPRVIIKDVWNTIPNRILAASPHLQGYDVPGEEIDRLKSEGLTLVEALEELGM